MTAFAAFVVDLRTSRYAALADDFTLAFREVEIESGKCLHIHRFRKALTWIVSQPKSVDEKMVALLKLWDLPNTYILIPSLRRFLEW